MSQIFKAGVAAAAILVVAGMQSNASAATISPRQADGCNGRVCINVVGTGLHVAYIDTSFSGDLDQFQTGQYITQTFSYANGNTETYYAYPRSGDRLDNIQYNRNFPNNTKVCTRIRNSNGTAISGNPCETIHS
ncbi:hypothetical protein [Streptomyces mirabilis]|uniref:hypothetical protein n=1 Tax=Streptomyces mirabilis TaxID=68239 RepID=UPI0036B1841F